MAAVAQAGSVSVFDRVAPDFERHRALPEGVTREVRQAILTSIGGARPRLLDLGAGTGRFGLPFVAAGDDYVAADLSIGMLRRFQSRAVAARLLQCDGAALPFRDAAFDAVLLIQVFGGQSAWRRLLDEAQRVLRESGALVLGRIVAPPAGIDARMKQRLDEVFDDMKIRPERVNTRGEAERWLERVATGTGRVGVANWTVERTPRGFLDRHAGGARLAALPEPLRRNAIGRLGAWATQTFGSLDTAFTEPRSFELLVFRFPQLKDGQR